MGQVVAQLATEKQTLSVAGVLVVLESLVVICWQAPDFLHPFPLVSFHWPGPK